MLNRNDYGVKRRPRSGGRKNFGVGGGRSGGAGFGQDGAEDGGRGMWAGGGGRAKFGAVGPGEEIIGRGAAAGDGRVVLVLGDGLIGLAPGDELGLAPGDELGLAPGRVPARQRVRRCSRHSRARAMRGSSRAGASVGRRSRVTMRAMAALSPERMRARRVVRINMLVNIYDVLTFASREFCSCPG